MKSFGMMSLVFNIEKRRWVLLDCHHCGTPNAPDALYCVHDGFPLHHPEPNGYVKVGSQSCGTCGANITNDAAGYCAECGSSLEKYASSSPHSSQHTYFDLKLVQKTLPGLLLSIVILLGMGQIFLIFLKENEQFGLFWNILMPISQQIVDSLNVLDMTLFAHLTSMTMTMEGTDFSQQMTYISSGIIPLLFIAVTALMAGGFLIKWLAPLIEEWKAAVFVAVGYAVFLGVIAPLAGIATVENGDARTSIGFHMVSAVLNGLFIGFIFSYAGMVLRKGALIKKMRVLAYQRALYYGTFVFIAGCGLMLLVSTILTIQYEMPPELEEQGNLVEQIGRAHV